MWMGKYERCETRLTKGVVHDLYYYCDTCAIRAVAPGDCVCCQAPVELVEKPIKLAPLSD